MQKTKLRFFTWLILILKMKISLVYASTMGAAVGSSLLISEDILLFCLALFLGVIGWFIKVTFDRFGKQLDRQNDKLDSCVTELVATKENLRSQNEKIELWHKDRREIFDRLRAIESS